MISEKWDEFLKAKQKALIFDTETSGLGYTKYDILSLSWQVIDLHSWSKLSEGDVYFDWVSDERVQPIAIKTNGLTKERLAELGTIDRAEGMKIFTEALADVDLVVAHNASFDKTFVDETVKRESLPTIEWPVIFDTQNSMTTFCRLPKKDGGYKNPKLEELADILEIAKIDIVLHQSSFDVELTKRCFRKIVEDGLVAPTIAQFHDPSEKKSSKYEPGHFGLTNIDGFNLEDKILSDFDFEGKKCVVSGKSSYRDKIKKKLPKIGAKVMGDISGLTDILIVSENGVGKTKKEKALAELVKRPGTLHVFSHDAVARKLGLDKE